MSEKPDIEGTESVTVACSRMCKGPGAKNGAVKEIWYHFCLNFRETVVRNKATEVIRTKS